ncbi:hypothetical protein [Amycolatopsis magusensis]|uniref:hypothetical protein n=1 Tax=Amycolatopsis magusensis TaxID=882444 RepID=UPI0037B8164B
MDTELGGDVYGLCSIFEAARELRLPRPQSTSELRALLHKHLYVEGDADYIRLDEHSLRVRTDDDEVELAYYFLDDEVVATAPHRLAYLVHESWPLPDQVGRPQPFVPEVAVTLAAPVGADEATTYAVLLTFYDGESLARCEPWAFPGVELPRFAQHLRATSRGEWPPELVMLRALVAPEDDAIRPALEWCNRWPGFSLDDSPWPSLPPQHEAAHRQAMEQVEAATYADNRRPEASQLRAGRHLAQLSMHCSDVFGYQQWYLFDTLWAATHPDLAQSLLRYAHHWDPLDD